MEHKIISKDIDSLIFAEYNPRQLTKDQYKHLKDSIDRFGLVDPIIVNSNPTRKNIIVGGHQRVKVAKDMNIKEVPVLEVDLTYDRERELNVRLNANTGEWDTDILANMFDIDELTDWGFDDIDLKLFDGIEDNNYTRKIESPIYEPKNVKPKIKELFDISKSDCLIRDIEKSNLTVEEKEFLKIASMRHIVFNYSKIADYYSHSRKELKELVEDSALVIIDFKKAIEKGYVELSEEISKQYLKDYSDEE